MTRIALIADLHGNRPAVEALEKDLALRGADRVWCLGDLVGKGPDSVFTCDWAKSNCEVILQGNWDIGVARRAFPNDRFYWEQLGNERLRWLEQLPREYRCRISGSRVRLIHGRPVMDPMLFIEDDRERLEAYFEADCDTLIYADTHRQGLRLLGTGKRLVNTGSVGNGMGLNQVQYCLMEGEADSAAGMPLVFSFPTLPYDHERAARDAEVPGLYGKEAYIREVNTGIYSRKNGPAGTP